MPPTAREIQLINKLQENREELNKWLLVMYAIITQFAKDTNYKIVIDNMSQFQVPTLDNPLEWEYNKETDTLTVQIVEPEEPKRIIEV